MYSTILLWLSTLSLLRLAQSHNTSSPKRGLVVVQTSHESDDSIWIRAGSDLTWYYNYQSSPSSEYTSNPTFQFVPMLYSAPSSASDTTFLTTILSQIQSGANITYVLAYNEPDGQKSTGGTDIPADTAASTWMSNVAPLREHGVKVGLPAVTGSPDGSNWLANFNKSCIALSKAGCVADFIPIHWYGDFQGFASHVEQVRATYPGLPIWVTEFADPDDTLLDTQSFYNESVGFLDQLGYVERYSYFGAFRSDASNVGPNVALLTNGGQLTDIGSWYLGGAATGNTPQSSAGAGGRFGCEIALLCLCALTAVLLA